MSLRFPSIPVPLSSACPQAALFKHVPLPPCLLRAELLAWVRQLHEQQPRRTSPVLGADGSAQTYEKRRFAADFKDNPLGGCGERVGGRVRLAQEEAAEDWKLGLADM